MSHSQPLLPFPTYSISQSLAFNMFANGDPFAVQRAFIHSPAGMQLLLNRMRNCAIVKQAAKVSVLALCPFVCEGHNVSFPEEETDNERDNREYSEWAKRSGQKPRSMPVRCVHV